MLPYKLRTDAWWMVGDLQPALPAGGIDKGHGYGRLSDKNAGPLHVLGIAICLIALSDFLIFGHDIGAGLVLFAAITGGAGLVLRRMLGQTSDMEPVAVAVLALGLLPVLEYVQALSLLFFAAGVIFFVSILNGGAASVYDRVGNTCRFGLLRFFMDAPGLRDDVALTGLGEYDWRQFAISLILPTTLGVAFIMLFVTANPVLEVLTRSFEPFEWLANISLPRLAFWIAILLLVWPILRFVEVARPRKVQSRAFQGVRILSAPLVTQRAVRNTLIVSNLLFMIQGITDFGYLFAGAELPKGMTYAQYAHRGAYPLLVTALLAGGFATATAVFARHDRLIHLMTVFWMIQTLALVGSSVFRLSLYIDAYGLTLLRVWAGIWMALVFTGICLVLVQIRQERSTIWLIKWNAILAAVTLYLCCFFNFTAFVAAYNLEKIGGDAATEYACTLGAHAAPSFWNSFGSADPITCFHADVLTDKPTSWREWSYRNYRLENAMAGIKVNLKETLPDTFNWRYDEGNMNEQY